MNIEKILSVAFLVPMGDPNSARCKMGLNVMLWGEPGIGKSDRVEAAGAMAMLPVRTTYAATSQPEDASGAAFINTSKGMAAFENALYAFRDLLEDPENLEQAMRAQASKDKTWLSAILAGAKGGFTQKLVKRVTDVLQQYGPSFSRIEPLLPGLSDLIADGQGVWFLDELSCARPAVQAAFLGAVLARRVGGLNLPPGVRIVAAANPPDSAAGGWELEPPMANRFCHFSIPTPAWSEWNNWLLNEGSMHFDPIDQGEARIKQRWADEWAFTKGLMTGFMQRQPSLLHKMPKEGSKDRGRAWPSPRTWVFAARAVATCRCLGENETVQNAFVEGCVGEGAATHFAAWVAESDLPTPQDMLKNGWKPDKKRLDRTIAAYTTMTSYVLGRTSPEEKKKLAAAAWTRLQDSCDAGLLDITLPLAHALVNAGLDTKAGNADLTAAARPVLVRLAKAGMSQFLTDPGVR